MNFFKLTLVLGLMFSVNAVSQVVEKVKAPVVLIDLQGNDLAPGSEWLTVNDVGRKTGWIRIKKVRDGKAVAEIVKGIVAAGQTLTAKPPPKSRFKEDSVSGDENKEISTSPAPEEDTRPSQLLKNYKKKMGVMLGYAMDTISFTAGNANNTITLGENMTGTGISLKGFYDWKLSPTLVARLTAGYDGFAASGSVSNGAVNNGGSTTSTLNITGLAVGADAEWALMASKVSTFWIGIGFTFDYLLSTSTNVISLSSPSFINYISPGLGDDIRVTKSMFIPVAFHYDYYIAGSGVTQNDLRFNAGVGWAY